MYYHRPPKYNNCLDFEAMCEMYFDECDSETKTILNKAGEPVEISAPEPYLKSGLALYLGLSTESLRLYSKDKESAFFAIIKRAYDRIQNNLEKRSILNRDQATGCLFNLKANFGMSETIKTESKVEQVKSLDDFYNEEG